MAGPLELRGEDAAHLVGGHGKGHQGGGDVQVLKGAAHGVLAADGGDLQLLLGPVGPQEGGQRLAPAVGILPQLLEVLLEAQVGLLQIGTGGHQFGHRLDDRQVGPVVGALLGDIGVIAPGHQGAGVGLPFLPGDLVDHGLGGGELILATEGHEDGAPADGGVKPLRQAPLGADVQVRCQIQVALAEVLHLVLQDGLRGGGDGGGVLLHPIGV